MANLDIHDDLFWTPLENKLDVLSNQYKKYQSDIMRLRWRIYSNRESDLGIMAARKSIKYKLDALYEAASNDCIEYRATKLEYDNAKLAYDDLLTEWISIPGCTYDTRLDNIKINASEKYLEKLKAVIAMYEQSLSNQDTMYNEDIDILVDQLAKLTAQLKEYEFEIHDTKELSKIVQREINDLHIIRDIKLVPAHEIPDSKRDVAKDVVVIKTYSLRIRYRKVVETNTLYMYRMSIVGADTYFKSRYEDLSSSRPASKKEIEIYKTFMQNYDIDDDAVNYDELDSVSNLGHS